MTKSQLTEEVAKETSQSQVAVAKTLNSAIAIIQVAVAKTLNSAIAIIQEAVSNGIAVSIQSFISFTPIVKQPIEGEINGTKFSKPQRQGIKLKAMKPFKDLVENGVEV